MTTVAVTHDIMDLTSNDSDDQEVIDLTDDNDNGNCLGGIDITLDV